MKSLIQIDSYTPSLAQGGQEYIAFDRMPTADEADQHWQDGNGVPIRIPFSVVEFDPVSPNDFPEVSALLGSANGRFRGFVDDRISVTTTGDSWRILGDITLRLQGTLDISPSGSWNFEGTLRSFDDVYNWDWQWTRPIRSIITTGGRIQVGDGTPYDIQIRGSEPITGGGG